MSKLILVFLILWNSLSFSEMHIEITKGINTACPISILPFVVVITDYKEFTLSEDVASIIASDLHSSGKFNILPIPYLSNHPSNISDIVPMFWKKLGINTIVLGNITLDHNENYIVSYQLIDTSENPSLVILENKFSIKKTWLRYISHVISNEIFEKLTGIKGIFCSRIAYIIYTKSCEYPYELCIADYDGHNQIIICRSKEPLMSPAWSIDGKQLAYVSFSKQGYSKLVIQTLKTGFVQNIVNFPKHNGSPAFSPDGKKIVFVLSKTGSLNLYIMDLISGDIHQLTKNRYNNTEPNWFPDSTNLVYTSDQGGSPQVYQINIYTKESKRLSWIPSQNQNSCVSKDGKFIIMVNRNNGKQNIVRLDLLTGKTKTLTNSILNDTPSISPNNSMIIYSSLENLNSILKLVSVDGDFKTSLLKKDKGIVKFPSWSPCI